MIRCKQNLLHEIYLNFRPTQRRKLSNLFKNMLILKVVSKFIKILRISVQKEMHTK